MSRIILQPCGDPTANEHYNDTIESPVPVDVVNRHLTAEQRLSLGPAFEGRKAIPTWGVVPGVNSRKWERIQPGDIALFSRAGRIFASSTVVEKVHNSDLALALWQTDPEGRTWEHVYFLDELRHVDIPYADFNRAAGYSAGNVIQGFNVLTEDKSAEIISAFDLESSRQTKEIEADDFAAAVRGTLPDQKSLDKYGIRPYRVEQQFLRRSLFGRRQLAACSLCGSLLPVDLLCASHIKRRARCSTEERLDYKNVVAAMCLLGCDSLYEKGYVFVQPRGQVVRGRSDIASGPLAERIELLTKRTCAAWSESSEPYFKWHREEVIGR